MTNVTGVGTGTNGIAATGAATNTTGAAAQSATVQETASGTVVKIKQADGSTFDYVIPAISRDDQGNWVSKAATGMEEVAKTQNAKVSKALKADDFMRLLVAQLRYQDPSNPADTSMMMQQTASMAMIERVNEMASAASTMSTSAQNLSEANTKLVSSNEAMSKHLSALLAQQSLSAAIGLIGQNVTYKQGSGDASVSKTGVVESVKLGDSGPILTVNGTDVVIGDVTGVSRTASTTTTAGSAAGNAAAAG